MYDLNNSLDGVLKHRSALVRYAARIVRDTGHAEDVVQEALIRFSGALQTQLVEEPLRYLYRIVRNVALDRTEKLANERRHFVDLDDAALNAVASSHPTPATFAEDRDELRLLLAALEELPPRTRAATELYCLEDLRLKDISERLGISIGLAHRLVADGLDHCRTRLQRR